MSDIPGILNFPTSLDSNTTLIQVTNSAASTLASSINTSVTSIPLADGSLFPSDGFITITTSGAKEIAYYTSKSSNTLNGVTRGQAGTLAIAHTLGDSVELKIIARHHSVLTDAIIAIESKLGTSSSTPTSGFFLKGSGTGSSVWSALSASDISTGTLADARLSSNVAFKNTTNTFTARQTINSGGLVITTDQNVDSNVILMKSNSMNGYYKMQVTSAYVTGGSQDETWSIQYNDDLSQTDQPHWGENLESRYIPGSPPLGLFEKNWGFDGLPGVNAVGGARENFRPYSLNINLNNNRATFSHNCYRFSIWDKVQTSPAFIDALPDTRVFNLNGRIEMNSTDNTNPAFHLQGDSTNSSFVIYQPTAINTGPVYAFYLPALNNYTVGLDVEGSIRDGLLTVLKNTSSNANAISRVEIESAGSDPSVRFMDAGGANNVSLGMDKSDGNSFKLDFHYTVGSNTALKIDTSNNATFFGNMTLSAKYLDVAQMTTPSSPSSGTRRLYVDSGTGAFSLKKSDGSVINLESGGGGGGGAAGSTTQVQYNLSGSLTGATGFEYQAASSPTLMLQAQSAAFTAFLLKATTSQSGHLLDVQDVSSNSKFHINKDGNIRVGAISTSSDVYINVDKQGIAASSTQTAIRAVISCTNTNDISGLSLLATGANTSGTVSNISGISGTASSSTLGNITNLTGLNFTTSAKSTGTVTNMAAAKVTSFILNSTVTSLIHLGLYSTYVTGTITQSYGIYIDSTIGTGATSSYAIYSGCTSQSYLAGSLQTSALGVGAAVGTYGMTTGATLDSTSADLSTAVLAGNFNITKNNSNTRTLYGMLINPTLNTGVSNLNTTLNVFAIDTINTGITGLTTNLLKLSYGSSDRLIVDSAGTITLTGGQKEKRTAVSSNYSILVSDYIIAVTSTASARTLTLPSPATAGSGARFVIVDESGACSTNNITLVPNSSETINGDTSVILNSDYGSFSVYTNGTNWFII